MFDLISYTNGFGVIFVPFVVGVIIRAILAALNAGSHRAGFYSIIFIVFFTFPSISFSGQFTGTVDSLNHNGSILYIENSSTQYYSDNAEFKDILISSFYTNQEMIVTFDDLDNKITNISITSFENLDSKNISLFLGGVACAAFALGISLKI